QIPHGGAGCAEIYALVSRRKKSAAPQAREQWLVRIDRAGLRDQDDECREILVVAAEPITHPRAQTGTPGLLAAGLDKRNRGVVINRFGICGFDDRDVVDDLRVMR